MLPMANRDCSTCLIWAMFWSKFMEKLSAYAYFIAMFFKREIPRT